MSQPLDGVNLVIKSAYLNAGLPYRRGCFTAGISSTHADSVPKVCSKVWTVSETGHSSERVLPLTALLSARMKPTKLLIVSDLRNLQISYSYEPIIS